MTEQEAAQRRLAARMCEPWASEFHTACILSAQRGMEAIRAMLEERDRQWVLACMAVGIEAEPPTNFDWRAVFPTARVEP